MIFNTFTQKAIFAGLLISSSLAPVVAQDVPVQEAAQQIPTTLTYIPGGQWAYTETLGKRPGTCILATGALFGAYVIRQQYKQWHNARARTRRTILEKIQNVYSDYSNYGNSDWGNVHNQQQLSVVQSLHERKNELLRDARTIYNWGITQDGQLITLIEEFFAVLAKKTSGNQLPANAAPVAQPAWWKFWTKAQPAERLLEDIVNDIKERLCGSCN